MAVSASPYHISKRLIKTSGYYLIWIIIGFILNGIASAIDSSLIYGLKPILNHGFIEHRIKFIHGLPLLIMGAFLIRGIANVTAGCSMSYASCSIVMKFRQQIFAKFLKLPVSYYDHQSTGNLLSLMIFNVDQLSNASSDMLTTLAQSGCLTIGLLTVMLTISYQLTLICLIAIPLMMLILRWSNRRVRKFSQQVQSLMAELTHKTEETIKSYKIIRIYGGEYYEKKQFRAITQENRRRNLLLVLLQKLTVSSVQWLMALVLSIVVYLALSHHIHLTAGAFVAFVAALLALLKPVKDLTQVLNNLQRSVTAAETVFKLLDTEAEIDHGKKYLKKINNNIIYNNISMRYKNRHKPALHQINFELTAGQTLAIVGRSGSGKTTLVNLLARFYEPDSGEILIDNINIKDLKLSNLRSHIAFVSQDILLFNNTIAHNIAYGRLLQCSEQDIIKAAKAAHAWEFIEKMPGKLNTVIGEKGVLLSGGQRQRIALARAILNRNSILILDEATAALDSESEQHIQLALSELMGHCTTLVIAHRLSTIENADIILVLDQGQLVETGNHRELIKKQDGYYAKLYRLQFKV